MDAMLSIVYARKTREGKEGSYCLKFRANN
jgi:hypothetical protein